MRISGPPYIKLLFSSTLAQLNRAKKWIYLFSSFAPKSQSGLLYYLEQVTSSYGNEKLLINKQMIKTGSEDIPDIKEMIDSV